MALHGVLSRVEGKVEKKWCDGIFPDPRAAFPALFGGVFWNSSIARRDHFLRSNECQKCAGNVALGSGKIPSHHFFSTFTPTRLKTAYGAMKLYSKGN